MEPDRNTIVAASTAIPSSRWRVPSEIDFAVASRFETRIICTIPPKDSSMHAKKLRAYLDSAAGIAGLLPQAERLIELRHIYRKLVPQQLLRSSSIVNYRQQTGVI